MKKLVCVVVLISTSPIATLSNDLKVHAVNSSVEANESALKTDDDFVKNVNNTNNESGDKQGKKATLQSKSNQSHPLPKVEASGNKDTPNYDDEQTYLDLFGERAKELLTQHIIPTTDAKCRWDWRMGRCEPYCECGYYFLWGDYHLGRSCRLRSKFTPIQRSDPKKSSESLQDAWQQWADHMDDPDAFSSFVDSGSRAKKTQNRLNECSLPPESRYTQGVQYVSKLLGHGTIVLHQFQKLKNHALQIALNVKIRGKLKFDEGRENACDKLKLMIEDRERERNQPVILTRRGLIWIRRICGTGNATVVSDTDDIQSDEVNVCNDNVCSP